MYPCAGHPDPLHYRLMSIPLPQIQPHPRNRLLDQANVLAILTIGYNLLEGIVSMGIGGADEWQLANSQHLWRNQNC